MKKNFLTGLVILLPVVVTIAVLIFLINLFTKPFVGIVSDFLSHLHIINRGFLFLTPEQLIRYGSQAIILILLFLITMGLGMITRSIFMKALFHLGDRIIARIPLVNTVYKTTQDIIKTVFVSDKNSFKQVVLAPFPREGVYVVGLIARESPYACRTAIEAEDLVSVLVPTTPNPTTGFLLMFRRKDLIFVDMKPEDAIKYVVSCGLIIPEHKPQIPPV